MTQLVFVMPCTCRITVINACFHVFATGPGTTTATASFTTTTTSPSGTTTTTSTTSSSTSTVAGEGDNEVIAPDIPGTGGDGTTGQCIDHY